VDSVLVTGATGMIGGNVCRLLAGQGRRVRALVRDPAEAGELSALGAELVTGDITRPETLTAAVSGCAAVVHAAAVLGGASQDLAVFAAVNDRGTAAVLDAAAARHRRVIITSSPVVFDESRTLTETSDLSTDTRTPYTVTKRQSYVAALRRARAGEDIVVVVPGSTYGPAPVAAKSFGAASYNRLIRGALRGRMTGYPRLQGIFSPARDVAAAIVAALDKGIAGETYLAFGAEDALESADFFNLACELARVSHRVPIVELDPADPKVVATYGESIAAALGRRRPVPAFDNTRTRSQLDYQPHTVTEALTETVGWLRTIGQIA
jgi:dihydroflavonol-4-reductase